MEILFTKSNLSTRVCPLSSRIVAVGASSWLSAGSDCRLVYKRYPTPTKQKVPSTDPITGPIQTRLGEEEETDKGSLREVGGVEGGVTAIAASFAALGSQFR